MIERTGWLLDVYAHPQDGLVVWLLDDDGTRRRLRQPFPVTFYAAGPPARLRAMWRFLKEQPLLLKLSRTERRDLPRSRDCSLAPPPPSPSWLTTTPISPSPCATPPCTAHSPWRAVV
jgi:hypothetical protein